EIDDRLSGPRPRKQRGKLRPLILNFDRTLDEIRLGLNSRTARTGIQHDAQSERRPWRRLSLQMTQRGQHLLRLGTKRIDPEIEWRAVRQCDGFVHARVAEAAGELRIQ